MARPTFPILATDSGRAQTAALVVLAVLASAQVLLVFRSVWLSSAETGERPVAAVSAESAPAEPNLAKEPSPSLAPPDPGQLAGFRPTSAASSSPMTPPPSLAPPTPGQLAGGPASSISGAPVMENVSSPPAAMPVATGEGAMNPELAELLDTVQQLRPLGDTAGMLAVLRQCELLAPMEPAVLHEFALTYEQMGLGDKALSYWQRLEALGPDKGATFYPTALQRLQGLGQSPASTTTPGVTGAAPPPAISVASAAGGQVLKIGRCEVVKDRAVTEGERVILRIPIERVGAGVIEPQAVGVDVFFFDLVNGSTVEQTRADAPTTDWVSAPVDWSGNDIELLDVVYSLPPMTPQEVRDHGQRGYYGYVVKIYYQNKLQGTAANPPDLLDDGQNSPAPGALPGVKP